MFKSPASLSSKKPPVIYEVVLRVKKIQTHFTDSNFTVLTYYIPTVSTPTLLLQ